MLLIEWVTDRKTIIGKILASIGTGILVSVGFYFVLFIYTLACDCFHTRGCIPKGWDDTGPSVTVALIPAFAGAIIGTIYAIAAYIQDNSGEREKKRQAKITQRKNYAADFQRMKGEAVNKCSNYRETAEKTKLQFNSSAAILQENLLKVIDRVFILMQKIHAMLIIKHDSGIENSLNECREDLNKLQKEAQGNITLLEEKEKELEKAVIDYNFVIGEFEHYLSTNSSKVNNIGNSNNKEITLKNKKSLINQLENYRKLSKKEIDNLKNIEISEEHYLKYSQLDKERKTIVSVINENISRINNILTKAKELLTQTGFEEIVIQSYSGR